MTSRTVKLWVHHTSLFLPVRRLKQKQQLLDGSSVDPPAACSHCKLRAGVAQTVCCKLGIKIRLRHCDRYFCIIRLIWCLILQPRYAQHLTTSGTAGGGYKLSHSDEVKSIYDSSMPRCAQHVSHAPDYVLHSYRYMCYIRTGIKEQCDIAAALYCSTVVYNNHIAVVNGLETQSVDSTIFGRYG